MTTLTTVTAHGAPAWSPYAVLAGILVGFVLGAITAVLYALRLQHVERIAAARAARRLPDPAAWRFELHG